MGKGNPRKAMAALLPTPIGVGGGLAVRPMTLGMWAALERIGSPLVTGEVPKDALELLPSLYLLTHDPREVFRGNVLDLAMQWADTVPGGARERRLGSRAHRLDRRPVRLGVRGDTLGSPALGVLAALPPQVRQGGRLHDGVPSVRNREGGRQEWQGSLRSK